MLFKKMLLLSLGLVFTTCSHSQATISSYFKSFFSKEAQFNKQSNELLSNIELQYQKLISAMHEWEMHKTDPDLSALDENELAAAYHDLKQKIAAIQTLLQAKAHESDSQVTTFYREKLAAAQHELEALSAWLSEERVLLHAQSILTRRLCTKKIKAIKDAEYSYFKQLQTKLVNLKQRLLTAVSKNK